MTPQRILIADDDEKVLNLLASSLRKSGYTTSQALNGTLALELAKSEHPDLILADIAMPEMDGFELCRLIREDPATMDIPFVFLTAKGELNDRVTGLNLGADDYISKPFHISEVTARIKAILSRVGPLTTETPTAEAESDLKGNLEQLSLAEILQTLEMAQKTGGLTITNGAKVGKIYFDQGNIIQAALDKYKSEEAIYRILAWDEGSFEFDSEDRREERTITSSATSVLMDGFNQREEYLKYKKVMPPFETTILKIADLEKAEETKLAAQKVLVLVDSQRTIWEIVNISPLNYLFTIKILYTLLKKGIIEVIQDPEKQGNSREDYGELARELYD